ncbi:hypothetical protein HPB47_000053 [Ixodes persulcatus]|uniref:Uncharacterized protein n=1 Tax=Ixodes persulcatus TaxID=34615 RepID=A0AC60PUQ1_IXOPE|nr:hypothetical protein HPB47_000053 [Ixodes persulcatus]
MPASVARREKMSNGGSSEQSPRAQARPEKDVSKPVLLYDPSCHEAKQLERFGQVGAQKEDDERFRPRSAHKPGCVQQTGYREAKDVGPALLSSSSGQRSLASDDDKQPPEQGSSSTNGHFTRPMGFEKARPESGRLQAGTAVSRSTRKEKNGRVRENRNTWMTHRLRIPPFPAGSKSSAIGVLFEQNKLGTAGSAIYPVAVSSSLINPEAPSCVAVEGDLEAASPAEAVLVAFCLYFSDD